MKDEAAREQALGELRKHRLEAAQNLELLKRKFNMADCLAHNYTYDFKRGIYT